MIGSGWSREIAGVLVLLQTLLFTHQGEEIFTIQQPLPPLNCCLPSGFACYCQALVQNPCRTKTTIQDCPTQGGLPKLREADGHFSDCLVQLAGWDKDFSDP
jgi:hypothetical protein